MIVCSCNVFSDHQVRATVAKTGRRPRMSQIYGCLGRAPQCCRCAHAIKLIMDEIRTATIPLGQGSAGLQLQ